MTSNRDPLNHPTEVYQPTAFDADQTIEHRPKQAVDLEKTVKTTIGDFGRQDLGEATALYEPGTQIGPYELLQLLGEGGMGAVYEARQEEPVRRTVALKVIKPGINSVAIVNRFQAELQALAMMDHPNIATVLDAGLTESGLPYFVMEFVRGIPVTTYCVIDYRFKTGLVRKG